MIASNEAPIEASIEAPIEASIETRTFHRKSAARRIAVAAFVAATLTGIPRGRAEPAAARPAPATDNPASTDTPVSTDNPASTDTPVSTDNPAPAAKAPAPATASPVRATATRTAAPASPPRRPAVYVRLGAALIKPVSSSRELELADVHGAASLAVQNGPIRGSGATIDSAATPAAIIGYVLPTASRRWSTELVLGAPFTVKFHATGTLATTSIAPMALGIPTGVGPLGSDLGEAQAAPLVITATYRLIDHRHVWPYVGIGPSVLFSRNAKVTNPILTEVNHPEMSIDPAPGLVFQGGLEARLPYSLYARIDVKFIAFMLARAEVRDINVKTPGLPLFDSVEVGTAKMSLWVNPVIVQAGLGCDFW